MALGPYRTVVFADIPGLIEGAHAVAGLGDWFLRHIERTKILLHLVDLSAPDPLADYREIQKELKAYSPKVAKKLQVVVPSKMDLPDAKGRLAAFRKKLPKAVKVVPISAPTGEGLKELLGAVVEALGPVEPEAPKPLPMRIKPKPERRKRFMNRGLR